MLHWRERERKRERERERERERDFDNYFAIVEVNAVLSVFIVIYVQSEVESE